MILTDSISYFSLLATSIALLSTIDGFNTDPIKKPCAKLVGLITISVEVLVGHHTP